MMKILFTIIGSILILIAIFIWLFLSGMGCMSSTGSSLGCNNPLRVFDHFDDYKFVLVPFILGCISLYFAHTRKPAKK